MVCEECGVENSAETPVRMLILPEDMIPVCRDCIV